MIKNICKTFLLAACAMIAAFLRQKQLPVILMYHSFDTVGWRYGVAPQQLRDQIEYLRVKKSIVALTDIVQYAASQKDAIENSVAITIDDGYEDTYSVFFPLAKKYKIPFTLFLTTDLSEKPNLGNLPRPSWDQIIEMYESGLMSIGLHGHTHTHFTTALQQGLSEVKREIDNSAALIQVKTGVLPDTAAYPSGEYNQEVIEYLKATGYITASLSTHSGFVTVGDDLFTLKRVEVNRNMSKLMFRLRLTAALDIYNKIISRVKPLLS